MNIANRLNHAGTTDTEKLVEAFEDYHYDAGKKQGAYFRKCDHQAIQQTYTGVIVPKSQRKSEGEYFVIGSTVGGDFAAGPCSTPDSTAATAIITSEKVPARDGYTTIKV